MRGAKTWAVAAWMAAAGAGCNGEAAPRWATGLLPPDDPPGVDEAGASGGSAPDDSLNGAGGSPPVTCPECGGTPPTPAPAWQTCLAVPPPPLPLEARPVFSDLPALTEPVALSRPAGGRHWYVMERSGRLLRFEDRPDVSEAETVLDIGLRVDVRGDGGLVAAAFHPRFAENGQLFLSYTTSYGEAGMSVVSRFVSSDGGQSFDTYNEQVLLSIEQPDSLHVHLNGDLRFGPDGYLYAGFGDGGPQGDPLGHAQDLTDLRGKILRLDVDGGHLYGIPKDNPVPSGLLPPSARPEIWAYGLRNPWRFSFDRVTGLLWAGDVGFFTAEEVNLVGKGANLGWPLREGHGCTGTGNGNGNGNSSDGSCQRAGLTAPVAEYKHAGMGASVTGGFVYRGTAIPSLVGRYVYADFARGEIWALGSGGRNDDEEIDKGAGVPELMARTGRRLVSFAEEPGGELLLVDFAGGTLLRLEQAAPSAATLPATLGATGCFQPTDPRQPAPSLIPYEVRVPFWSDSAVKRRFMALPDGQSAEVREDGSLAFPVGSVLVKEFSLDGRPVETRLMMKYGESQWTGISYVWNQEGTDATLRPEGPVLRQSFGAQSWSYPSRNTCLGCHTSDRGLGLELAQLDLPRADGGGSPGNQLTLLREKGAMTGQVTRGPRLPGMAGRARLEDKARAYLHVNCSMCHSPGGPTPVDMDLRFTTALAATRLCGVAASQGDLGVNGARRLQPGAPESSLLSLRMRASGRTHMPPIGPEHVDPEGAALIDAWITGLPACP